MDLPSASVEQLGEDHRTIEKALGVLQKEIERGRGGNEVRVGLIRELCEFSQFFVDRCHHGKEEGCFFPCLERRGMPHDSGPIAVMLEEHAEGRRLVARILESLDAYSERRTGSGGVMTLCQEYVDLLTRHILKEKSILFPVGAQVMEGHDDLETLGCFEHKKEEAGSGNIERLTSKVEELARK